MLEDLAPTDRRRTCKVHRVASQLEENDRRILEDAVSDAETWSINGLAVALRDRGLMVTREALDRHRRGVCSCSTT